MPGTTQFEWRVPVPLLNAPLACVGAMSCQQMSHVWAPVLPLDMVYWLPLWPRTRCCCKLKAQVT